MARSYYKCRVPRTRRQFSNGQNIPFVDIGNDHGLFSTEDANQIREIDQMVAEQRGGIWKIDEAEYQQLKKNRTSSQTWREELSRRGIEVNKQPQANPASANLYNQGAAAEAELSKLTVGPAPSSQTGGTGVNLPTATATPPPPRPTATKRK